jgi:hypothetical protein
LVEQPQNVRDKLLSEELMLIKCIAGQLAISHNTISRKHLTITVSPVEKGQAHNPRSRSTLTIEDLATKIGTVVNGEKIKGKRKVIEGDKAEFTMGKCPNRFR